MPAPEVFALTDHRALDPALAGAKATNLARAVGLGVPVLPGFVVSTSGTTGWAARRGELPGLREAWDGLGGTDAVLVVRSSSTVEDATTSSMAGQFTSVLDVRGWDAFLDAVDRVVASADRVAAGGDARPIAVLVQPQLEVHVGGVLFGVDPVTGDRRHVVVEVVPGRPDTLVSGTATAGHLVLDRWGRVLEHGGGPDTADLGAGLRRTLTRLARRAAERFGAPQDVEWAVDTHGRCWLLQTRPVTAVATPTGHHDVVLGPGPVAETFPDPLAPLEQDLFLPPLRDGITGALRLTGAVGADRIERSPVLVAVGGRAAVDLHLLGLVRGRATLWERVSPAALVRHVAVAWRVGRVRVALPALAEELLDEVDDHLTGLPAPDELDAECLLGLLDRAARELATVHRYEVLAGMLLHERVPGPSAAVVALGALADGRRRGATDAEVVARHPEVLALTAPAVGRRCPLPSAPAPVGGGRTGGGRTGGVTDVDALGTRDALRLRTRWLQELLARVAGELGARLARDGRLDRPEWVRWMHLDELVAVASGGALPDDVAARAAAPPGAPLPPAFRLGADGTVHAVHHHHGGGTGGIPAGGGRAAGRVCHRPTPGPSGPSGREGADAGTGAGGRRTAGRVLVVRHLEPELAPLLGGVDGLVAETGSALSHLAIVARELGVATVVGVEGAVERFPPGVEVLVDGSTGEVRELTARTA